MHVWWLRHIQAIVFYILLSDIDSDSDSPSQYTRIVEFHSVWRLRGVILQYTMYNVMGRHATGTAGGQTRRKQANNNSIKKLTHLFHPYITSSLLRLLAVGRSMGEV